MKLISSSPEFSQEDAAEVKSFSFWAFVLRRPGISHLHASESSELLCKKSGCLPVGLMRTGEVLRAHSEQEAWPSLS